MKEKFGIGGIALMDERSRFFPRFSPLQPSKPNTSYTKVTYTPGGYYCEKWEYLSPQANAGAETSLDRSRPTRAGQTVGKKNEWWVDLFFAISVGLFLLAYLWAQGLL